MPLFPGNQGNGKWEMQWTVNFCPISVLFLRKEDAESKSSGGDLVSLVDKVQNASLQDVYLVFSGEFP